MQRVKHLNRVEVISENPWAQKGLQTPIFINGTNNSYIIQIIATKADNNAVVDSINIVHGMTSPFQQSPLDGQAMANMIHINSIITGTMNSGKLENVHVPANSGIFAHNVAGVIIQVFGIEYPAA